MCDPSVLNQHFGISGSIGFDVGSHGATVAELRHAAGAISVARQGAQVLHWTPSGQPPVVWLSPEARFAPGKSLRGGIPVCWPWFGPHPSDPGKPAHGFARNLDWQVLETTRLRHGTRIVMGFSPGEEQRTLWPHQAELTMAITLGETLGLELTTRNTGDSAFTLSQALHTYFQVGDIAAVQVEGLEGCEYIDKVNGDARVRQSGPVLIDGEVNRIYLGCPGPVTLVDRSLGRRILISKGGSASYVLWNPWEKTGAAFGDMGEDGYRRMLCVETTNCSEDCIELAPGASHCLSSEYRVEPID